MLATILLKDKKEYHIIVTDATRFGKAYSDEPKLLWTILVISETIRQGGRCIGVAGIGWTRICVELELLPYAYRIIFKHSLGLC